MLKKLMPWPEDFNINNIKQCSCCKGWHCLENVKKYGLVRDDWPDIYWVNCACGTTLLQKIVEETTKIG